MSDQFTIEADLLDLPPADSRVFTGWTLKQAKAIINLRTDAQAETNRIMRNGNHWMDGSGWVGPGRLAENPVVNDAALDAIKKSFVFRNVIAEIDVRHVNGVLGRPPHWKVATKRALGTVEEEDPDTGQLIKKAEAPADHEQSSIDEAQAALVAWWDKRRILTELKNASSAMNNCKRAVLRMYVPSGAADAEGRVSPATLEEALDLLHVQHMGTNEDSLRLQFPNATVYTDKDSRQQIGIFTYKDGKDRKDRAELTYLNELGETLLRVITAKGDEQPPMVLPLGGNLTMFEMTRPAVVNEAIVSQQKQLNMTITMEGRNNVLAGFAERTFFDVDWPGTTDPVTGKFTPAPINLGPGIMTSLQGAKYRDKLGNEQYRQPSVAYRDPVSPETFIMSEDQRYLNILQEAQQVHYALAGDAVVSAVSRVQARDAFKADLQNSAGELQAGIRWILETALHWASFLMNNPGAFDEFRVMAQCKVDSGPIGPDDMRVASEMYEKELWDKETAQSATGVEDVDAVNERIAAEKQERAKEEAANMAHAQKLMDAINPPPVDPVIIPPGAKVAPVDTQPVVIKKKPV